MSTGPTITVRVADHAAAGGDATLVTLGLGSCVAIALHDPVARVAGLAHVLLPDPSLSRDASNRAKFAVTAVPLLVEAMQRAGAVAAPSAWHGRLVGGASMFAGLAPTGGLQMGARNVVAARAALDAAGIALVAHDTGGDYGRSVYFHAATGRLLVRAIRAGERVL